MAMTYDEMIAVIQGAKEAKKIEITGRHKVDWVEEVPPRFNFCKFDYRIAPEPVKMVKMWQWARRNSAGQISLTYLFYRDLVSAQRDMEGTHEIMQRVDWTEIEVPERRLGSSEQASWPR